MAKETKNDLKWRIVQQGNNIKALEEVRSNLLFENQKLKETNDILISKHKKMIDSEFETNKKLGELQNQFNSKHAAFVQVTGELNTEKAKNKANDDKNKERISNLESSLYKTKTFAKASIKRLGELAIETFVEQTTYTDYDTSVGD